MAQVETHAPIRHGRYCSYCGAFEGMLHSPGCVKATEDGRTNIVPHPTEGATTFDLAKDTTLIRTKWLTIPIPPEVIQYRPEIARFVEAMVYKLGVHSKKGKWENTDIAKALGLLDGEVKELRDAISRGNMVEQLLEAADVANYALIISAKAMEK